MRCLSGTGFSREEASLAAINFAVCLPTPSRLKPVLQLEQNQSHRMHAMPEWDRLQPGRGQFGRHQFCSVPPDAFPAKAGPTTSSSSPFPLPLLLLFLRIRSRHHKTRLGCRPSAGFAQWAEPHGCGESAVRTGMSVRRGPTEQDRSEGTRRRRAKPGADTLGYLGCFSK
jgi:hypothetical protein